MFKVISTAAALTLFLISAAVQANTEIDLKRPAKATAVVEIDAEAATGSIRVVGWSQPEVAITGSVSGRDDAVEVSGDRDRILIEVAWPMTRGEQQPAIQLEIRVPAKARVEIETLNADLEISALEGELEAASVNGKVSVAGRPQQVDVSTVNGSVRVEAESGRFDVESVSGSVEFRGASGVIAAETVSGDLTVAGGVMQKVDLETNSGTIRLDAGLAESGSLDVESFSGEVVLTLPADIAASFDITTFSGEIQSDWEGQARKVDRYTPEKELQFATSRDSGFRVSIESFSGDIRLKRK